MGAIAVAMWLALSAAVPAPDLVAPTPGEFAGVATLPREPTAHDRGLAAAGAGLGAAAGHLLGVSTSLGGYGVLATAGVEPLAALLPTLLFPPLCAFAGAALAALPFTDPTGALLAGGAALLADFVATGVSSIVFLVVLTQEAPPNRAIDGAVTTLLVVPAVLAAGAAGAVAALAARPPDEADPPS